jgi:hypothetical protein
MNIKKVSIKNKLLIYSIIGVIIIIFLLIKSNPITKEETKKEIQMHGSVMFTDGTGTISKLDLEIKKIDTVLNSSRNGFISITRISKDEFILNESRGLVKYDVNTGNIHSMRTGLRQTFIKEYKKLFFYDDIKGLDRAGLYMASIDSLDNAILLTKAPERPNEFVVPIQIASDKIIFIGEDYNLWIYNISSGKLTTTGISGKYNPIAWISNRKILLCNVSGGGMQNIYEINLETKDIKETTSNYSDEVGLIYIDKYDASIYCRMISGLCGDLSASSHNLYVYFYKEDRNIKIASDVRMYSGVYIDK